MRDSRLLLRRIRWEMRDRSELNWDLMEHFGEWLALQLASRGIGHGDENKDRLVPKTDSVGNS